MKKVFLVLAIVTVVALTFGGYVLAGAGREVVNTTFKIKAREPITVSVAEKISITFPGVAGNIIYAVKNQGTANVSVAIDGDLEGEDYEASVFLDSQQLTAGSFVLAPGQQRTLTVTVKPTKPGELRGFMAFYRETKTGRQKVYTDDFTIVVEPVRVTLVTGAPADVAPGEAMVITFSAQNFSNKEKYNVVVSVAADPEVRKDVMVDGLSIIASDGSNAANPTFQLAPGQTAELKILLVPQQPGEFPVNVSIAWLAPN